MTDEEITALLGTLGSPALRTIGGEVLRFCQQRNEVEMAFEATSQMCHSRVIVQGGFITAMVDSAIHIRHEVSQSPIQSFADVLTLAATCDRIHSIYFKEAKHSSMSGNKQPSLSRFNIQNTQAGHSQVRFGKLIGRFSPRFTFPNSNYGATLPHWGRTPECLRHCFPQNLSP